MNDISKIIFEANKCLNCKKPMCKEGCPISTNIPKFINCIKNNEMMEAYSILQENNIMSDVCSNVCPYEIYCSGHCIKGIKGNPVNISMLEKFINLWARENNIVYEYKKEKNNNIKVAIIGSGPASLECAFSLARKGFNITIYEKEDQIGGLLTYGIPGFRLPRDITKKLTDRIKSLGINILTNIEFGKDINIEELFKKGYRAIFLGLGADIPSVYSLTNEKINKIYNSDYILKEYNQKNTIKDLGDVIVIGGGNVAIDSARAVLRMGAKSCTIVYRRDSKKMPSRKIEVDEAISDGVKIIYNTKVSDAKILNGEIEKVNCIKTDSSGNDVIDIIGSDFSINADSIVFAIGLKPNKELLESQNIELSDNGLVKVDNNYMTNINGVFAGGDLVNIKDRTVCRAIETGRKSSIRNQ